MELDRYVADLRRQLAATAASGSDDARRIAEQLSSSLDAAARLVLLEALSEAAGEITRDIAPGSIEVRLRGRDPEFAITLAQHPAFDEVSAPVEETVPSVDDTESRDDTSTSRTTLRLPDHLKVRVEEAAAREGLSVNTWLVRAIGSSLEPASRRAAPPETRGGKTFTGWAR